MFFTKEYAHPLVSTSGGTGVFYRNLAKNLAARGYEVIVFGSAKKQVSFQEDHISAFFLQDYFKSHKFSEFLRSLSGKLKLTKLQAKLYAREKRYLTNHLKKYIADNNKMPEVIETHDWDGMAMYLEEIPVPYVIRCHGSWTVLHSVFGYKNVPAGKLLVEKDALQSAENVLAISQYSKKLNEDLFRIKIDQIIYNGIDSNSFIPANATAAPNLLYFGDVSVEKGADVALQAFSKIKKTIPDCRLFFMGSTNGFDKRLGAFLPEHLHRDVTFYGKKQRHELLKILQEATIILMPSRGENFSLALLEVMSVGKPVICSAIPAFLEIIRHGENGMIAQADGEWPGLVVDLLRSGELRERLGTSARETVVKSFDLNLMVEETLNYYRRISPRLEN